MAKFELTGKVRFKEPMYKVLLPSGQEIYIEKRLRYLAVDEDATLYGFVNRPVVKKEGCNHWYCTGSEFGHEHIGYVKFVGDWRMSLMKIVGENAVFVEQKGGTR